MKRSQLLVKNLRSVTGKAVSIIICQWEILQMGYLWLNIKNMQKKKRISKILIKYYYPGKYWQR